MHGFRYAAATLVVCAFALPDAGAQTWERARMQTASFDLETPGSLEIDVPDGDVELFRGEDKRVDVQVVVGSHDLEWARKRFEEMNLTIREDRGRIRITADHPRRREWRPHRDPGFAVTIRVELPERFDVDIDSADGDVIVERLDGKLAIRTSDGDIRVRALSGASLRIDTADGDVVLGEVDAKRVEIESADGDVEATLLRANEVEIRTSDGDIRIDTISGALRATTADGDIFVEFDTLGETALVSSAGDITVYTQPDLRANLDLSGDELDIRYNFTLDGRLSDRKAHGSLNGGGPKLRVRTHEGQVVLAARR